MSDGMKKILIVVVLLAAIGAVIAAKQFNSKTRSESEADISIANNIDVAVNSETEVVNKAEQPVSNDVALEIETETVKPEVDAKTDSAKAAAVAITEKILAEPALPRLLELGSVTCIPCKMMKPIIDALEVEYAGSMKVEFIDVWVDTSAGKKYGVSTIPTQIFFAADGKELFRHKGFFAKEAILAKWQELGIDLEKVK